MDVPSPFHAQLYRMEDELRDAIQRERSREQIDFDDLVAIERMLACCLSLQEKEISRISKHGGVPFSSSTEKSAKSSSSAATSGSRWSRLKTAGSNWVSKRRRK